MVSTALQRIVWSLLLLTAYYFVGVVVFINLERQAELRTYAENRELYDKMKELYSFHHCEDPAFQNLSFCQKQAEFDESLRDYFNEHGNSIKDLQQWTVLGTVFYLTHLTTTIGYGHSHPQTAMGQLATIFFALGGIPIMGYFLAQVARCELAGIVGIIQKVCQIRMSIARRQVAVLWCLMLIILAGGALVYSWLEPWSYLESLYFCFVTLSTVGFGDYLPSSPASRAFSIFYIVFGLGIGMLMIAVLTGLVAESHDSVDSFVSSKFKEIDADCCCARSSE